ncbi:M23 family metallopeptidase [Sphingomonas sp. EC-HK361]|uniref:M23 family metallopeptidase n=1 Tax=Sphingomonas sp. EC-HK361 TaxID=2038397 RepID=UPI0018FE15D5|nr:M23 family metallopeptidase [Sphingomonas sp. EC-HK361]
MFLRDDHGLELAGAAGGRSFGRALVPIADLSPIDRLRVKAAQIDWVPDLGAQIGSRTWWRGLATCTALCAATWVMSPGLDRPIVGETPAPLAGAEWEEARTQAIAPLGLGADTGRRMAANDLVRPLAETPERPIIELTATLGDGDQFASALQRAGVGRGDAAAAADLVAEAVSLNDLKPGTRFDLTLGRRADRTVARPLEKLAFRARFDLNLALTRAGDHLALDRRPIAIDNTPLRIQGLVGSSLYRSARAAGAPAKVIESFLKAIATRLSIGRDVSAADSFDIIAEQQRAATGEVQIGQLLFAGLDQGSKKTQLVKWDQNGASQWFDAKGQTEQRGFMGMPVSGRISSTYGMRFHPLLGFMRMHKGLDIAAPYGTPIHAAVAGQVAFAGRSSGYGNFVKLVHGGGLASGYGHMSRIAVRPGETVSRGEVIGYVGSTGMSTGPHLHWEVWKNGAAVNPRSIALASTAVLSGEALRAFKARVSTLLSVKPGAR